MADDAEKTEEPSSKKLEDAKKEGNVPKSQDTSAFITLVVAVVVVYFATSFLTSRIEHLYHYYSSLIGIELTPKGIIDRYTTFEEYYADDKIKALREKMYAL